MSTHAPHVRPVTQWKAPGTARRVPVPTPEVVAARPQRDALHAALDGQPPPCAGLADIFTSGDEGDVAVAVELCTGCPARAACLEYGSAVDATVGVWGGRDMAVRDGRRRHTTDDTDDRQERTA